MENKEVKPCGCESDIHTCGLKSDSEHSSFEGYCEKHPEAPECKIYDV